MPAGADILPLIITFPLTSNVAVGGVCLFIPTLPLAISKYIVAVVLEYFENIKGFELPAETLEPDSI